MTVAIRTADPARHCVAHGIQSGATQTAPNPNARASSQTRWISSFVVSGRKAVCSMSLVNSARVIVCVLMNVQEIAGHLPAIVRPHCSVSVRDQRRENETTDWWK